MKRAAFLLLCISTLVITASAQGRDTDPRYKVGSNRASITSIEPDGFLGIRFGNTLRFAEDLFGEPNIKREGSQEWHFRGGEYDPFEALTILSNGRTINGFVAHLYPERLHFTDLSLTPSSNRYGTFYATRAYLLNNSRIEMLVVGDDSNYVRRITLVLKDKVKQ